jgi:hypothetical protein
MDFLIYEESENKVFQIRNRLKNRLMRSMLDLLFAGAGFFWITGGNPIYSVDLQKK